jgi:hypothetical protein
LALEEKRQRQQYRKQRRRYDIYFIRNMRD